MLWRHGATTELLTASQETFTSVASEDKGFVVVSELVPESVEIGVMIAEDDMRQLV